MVAPVAAPVDAAALMASVQNIASNSRLSDNTYVYVKNGSVRTESRFLHFFTSTTTKARSAQALRAAFRSVYDDAGRQASAAFDRSLQGAHQVKVGDLRRALQTAETQQKLANLLTLLQDIHGGVMGDPLAPTDEHARQQQLGDAMNRTFGDGASNIVLDSDARTAETQAARLQELVQNKPQRVVDALFEVCRQGPLTKERVQQTVKKFFASSLLNAVNSDLNELSPNPTLKQTVQLFERANRRYNMSVVSNFETQVVKDSALSKLLGLDVLMSEKGPLTEERQQSIRARLPALKAAAKQVRDAAARYIKDHPSASNDCKKYVKELAEDFIAAGRFGEKEVKGLKDKANERYWRETRFSYGLQYELNQHKNWNNEQKILFTDVMKKLHRDYPNMLLFTEGVTTAAASAAKYVSGIHAAQASDVASYGQQAQTLYIATLVLARENFAPLLLENFGAILDRAGGMADAVTLDDITTVCLGRSAPAGAAQKLSDVNGEISKLHSEFIAEHLSTPAMNETAHDWARQFNPAATPPEIEHLAHVWLKNQISSALAITNTGLRLDAAIKQASNHSRSVTLEDFVIKPRALNEEIKTKEEAVKAWLQDFQRQGVRTNANGGREGMGRVLITVTESNGQMTSVRNNTDGLTPEELTAFEGSKLTSKHQAVIDALDRLCGNNEGQRNAAIAMLSQKGPVFLNRDFAHLVDGSDDAYEHAAMIYNITKNDKGEVLFEMHSADATKAQLEVSVVIHTDGTHEISQLKFSPAAPQEVKVAAPQA